MFFKKPTQSTAPRPLWARYTSLLVLGAALSITGCAGTKVGPVTSHAPNTPHEPPRTIAVIVENDSPSPKRISRRKEQLAAAQNTAVALSESISKLLAARQLTVVTADEPADFILYCRILDVRSGSKALRVLIGYGAGKAILKVGVSLNDSRTHDGPSLLSFETDGTSGSMPGAGFTAAALVGDGVSALRKDGLSKEINQTTEDIDEQLHKYFVAQNWLYPKPNETGVEAWLDHNS
jgi:peroxiredoxin